MNFDKLVRYLDELENRYGVPGFDFLVQRDHTALLRRMGGFSDYKKTKPVSENDLYFMYSATKVITMTAVMQLLEQGKIGLEDRVSDYLPEFARMNVADHCDLMRWPPDFPTLEAPHHPAKTPITLRMLMTMTAGLNYDVAGAPILALSKETGNSAGTRQMLGAISRMPLRFEPGTHYAYSFGHDVMAGVIEVVSGQTFGEYLKKNIFEPLDIRDAFFRLGSGERGRLTAQYRVDEKTGDTVPTEQTNIYCLSDGYESGGAGLICTTEAYAAVIDALACGGTGSTGAKILSKESIARMAVNQLTDAMLPEYQMPWRMEYGYGLGVRALIHPEDSPSPQGEFGWDSAGGAYCLADPVNHLSIVYVQEILGMQRSYSEIHPSIRNLVYECLNS